MGIFDLKLTDRALREPTAFSREWDGFAIEQISLAGLDYIDFNRKGNSHYVARHDVLVEEGETRGEDGRRVALQDLRGTLTYLPPDYEVTGWSRLTKDRTAAQTLTAVYFDPAKISAELEKLYRGADKKPVLYAHDQQLGVTMDKIAALPLCKAPSLLAEHLCIVAAVETLPLETAGISRLAGSLSPMQFKLVKDFITAHLSQDIGLHELAAISGLSRFHFVRAFGKSSGGRSPYGYLQDRRAEEAMRLLKNTQMPLADIAMACGFGGTRTMARAVERLAGMTPSAYRRHILG